MHEKLWLTHEPITGSYLLLPNTSAYRGWSGCAGASFVCTVCVGQCDIQIVYIEISAVHLLQGRVGLLQGAT